jgi:hypothetical protein
LLSSLKLIDEAPNLILNLTRIPLNEQNPEGKKKPDNQEDAQEDNHCNGDPKRKFSKNLVNIPFHSTLPPSTNLTLHHPNYKSTGF